MFEGFSARRLAVEDGEIAAWVGGDGPPLMLLHGYPQTHAMWHLVAPELARDFTVVCPDLPGYGDSSKPPSTDDHAPYSKRSMAKLLVEAMDRLGFPRFALAGHDRGARVAYRLAFDHPDAVTRLATLDIIPTLANWKALDWRRGMGTYHWFFLAQPAPLPETLIGHDPLFYLHNTLSRWAAPGFVFAGEAMREYERAWADPEAVRGACEDYRAGATIDVAIDEADYGSRKIACPLLVLWGQRDPSQRSTHLDTWREWASDVRGHHIHSGHFLAEEAPGETAEALRAFFREA